jgi:hypothetical protein
MICRGKDGAKDEINSLVSIPSLLESTVDRVPVVFFSMACDCLLQTETEEQEGKRNRQQHVNNHKSDRGLKNWRTTIHRTSVL